MTLLGDLGPAQPTASAVLAPSGGTSEVLDELTARVVDLLSVARQR